MLRPSVNITSGTEINGQNNSEYTEIISILLCTITSTMLAFALPLLLAQVPGYGVPNYTVTYEMSRSTVVRVWRGAAGLAAARRSHALMRP